MFECKEGFSVPFPSNVPSKLAFKKGMTLPYFIKNLPANATGSLGVSKGLGLLE